MSSNKRKRNTIFIILKSKNLHNKDVKNLIQACGQHRLLLPFHAPDLCSPSKDRCLHTTYIGGGGGG